MGIFWVFFKTHHGGGHAMKLQVDANDNDQAIKLAQATADKMGFGWKVTHAAACR